MVTCAYDLCDNTFTPRSKVHRFCSSICKDRQRRLDQKEIIKQAQGAPKPPIPTPPPVPPRPDTTLVRGDLSAYETVFIVNDTQYPAIDWALWDVVCEIAELVQPDRLIAAGDMFDFPQLSTYVFNPYHSRSVAAEVEGFHRDVWEPLLEAAKPRQVDWLDGNHEDRIQRTLAKRAPELADSVSSVSLMRLEEVDTYIPYGAAAGVQLAPDLLVAHGWMVRAHSAMTAKAHVEAAGMSVLHGHTHRLGTFYRTTRLGTVQGWELGHMADPDRCPGFHGQGVPNWQQAAGHVVRIHRQARDAGLPGMWVVQPIPVFGVGNHRRVVFAEREWAL